MKDNRKSVKAMPILATFSVVIASINLVFSIVDGVTMWPAVVIFFSNITIFCCSIIENKSHKNNKDNLDK